MRQRTDRVRAQTNRQTSNQLRKSMAQHGDTSFCGRRSSYHVRVYRRINRSFLGAPHRRPDPVTLAFCPQLIGARDTPFLNAQTVELSHFVLGQGASRGSKWVVT